jgi:hypothetical protein
MRCIGCWDDLSYYGITVLTEEVHETGSYFLCKVTARGKTTLERALGVGQLALKRYDHRRHYDTQYLGSIMLAPEILPVLGVYALLESGCVKVWQMKNGELIGVEPFDSRANVEAFMKTHPSYVIRGYTYATSADDCKHQAHTLEWIH